MPSNRRVKVVGLLLLATVLILFYITHGASQTRTSEFYHRTVAAMDARQQASSKEAAELDEAKRMREVDELAKIPVVEGGKTAPDSAGAGAVAGAGAGAGAGAAVGGDQRPLAEDVKNAAVGVKDGVKDAIHGVVAAADGEKSVAGRKMMGLEGKPVKDDGVAKVGNTGQKEQGVVKDEEGPDTKEDHEVEVELNAILKKSPIIIFSKTYCPYSMKAKHILLEQYKIVPEPYVAELDIHPLGMRLQAALQKSTGRRTVPNVLISGKSIGGGDDIATLDSEDKLASTIREMGGKRIMEASRVPQSAKFRRTTR